MQLFKLVFFVPECNCQFVKDAIFKTGAGTIGNYSMCSWECLGTGQFLPKERSRPAIGEIDQLEKVDEFRVEILCTEENIVSALEALFISHPYEEPAYEVVSVYNYKQIKSRLKR